METSVVKTPSPTSLSSSPHASPTLPTSSRPSQKEPPRPFLKETNPFRTGPKESISRSQSVPPFPAPLSSHTTPYSPALASHSTSNPNNPSVVKPTTPSPPSRFSPKGPTREPLTRMRIVDYSDKAIVIYGTQTMFFKEQLQSRPLFGKYNPHLREGKGWVFSKKHEAEVRQFVADVEAGQIVPDP